MNELHIKFAGRFGNHLFQYCYGRALAQRDGQRLHVAPWLGQGIFQLDDPPADPDRATWPGWAACQENLIYTRSDALRWIQFQPEVLAALKARVKPGLACAHLRRGDYERSDSIHVVVSKISYERTRIRLGLPLLTYVSEEDPLRAEGLPDWLPDWYTLLTARILLRANSSFSWWAATLGNQDEIYSPIIDGLAAGMQDCEFVCGNYPKIHHSLTDLRLAP